MAVRVGLFDFPAGFDRRVMGAFLAPVAAFGDGATHAEQPGEFMAERLAVVAFVGFQNTSFGRFYLLKQR